MSAGVVSYQGSSQPVQITCPKVRLQGNLTGSDRAAWAALNQGAVDPLGSSIISFFSKYVQSRGLVTTDSLRLQDAVPLQGLQLLYVSGLVQHSIPLTHPSSLVDSGINPATLSGAIDVIVVRHVDENGEVTLSSSPFHVRFGKLQVLRAGEKRVTLRMPNNLPPPHVAPFNMKVVDTGEAFFVLETSEEVPEELLTSPVVMPTDVRSDGAS